MKLPLFSLAIPILFSVTASSQHIQKPLKDTSDERLAAGSLNEVVITGTKIAVAKNYLPFTVSVVSRQQIENSSESALLPVLFLCNVPVYHKRSSPFPEAECCF